MSEEVITEQVEEVVESPEESTEVVETAEAESTEQQEYTPNLSYKVKDEEMTFDERLHGAVNSPEVEEHLRELYTKAAGLDSYKEKYSTIEEQYGALVQGFKNLESLQKNKDVEGVIKTFKFTEDDILDYAEKILNHRELPEEQRQAIEKQRAMEQELETLRQQQMQTQESMQSQAMQRDLNELKNIITTEYSDVAKAMQDAGYDMAWEVGMRGHAIYKRDGVEPSIRSVVEEVAGLYKHLAKQNEPAPQEVQQEQGQRVPTLPNVQGNTNSPVKAKVKSLEDLQRLASMIPAPR